MCSSTTVTDTVTTIAPVSGSMVTTSLSGLAQSTAPAAAVAVVVTIPTVTTVTTTALQGPATKVVTTTDLTTTTNYAIL